MQMELTPKEARERSKQIDNFLAEEAKKMDPTKMCLILLLGPGDSGKSTVLKQMTLLHGNGFLPAERNMWKIKIHHNIVKNMQAILQDKTNLEGAKKVLDLQLGPEDLIPIEIHAVITEIMRSPAIQRDLTTKLNVLEDTAAYYLSRVENFLEPSYSPTDEDILNCRQKTESVTETIFKIQNVDWKIVDVAGQRDKRGKWASYFEKGVKAIIFVFSAASYNQQMEESPTENRLIDAIKLFQSLVTNPLLQPLAYIVFLNKCDLLKTRMKTHPVQNYLTDYTGNESPVVYLDFLKAKFRTIMEKTKFRQYYHRTTATDTNLMRKVIKDIK
ncbi:guanine nucleotide binding protein, alpha subunit [Gorgonomyces haynaldii]|nr:guanine nucleotide binding protein, alpha subunit [Gorgonomyces haynaldii]